MERISEEKNCFDGANGDPLHHQMMKLFWMLGPAYIRWAESIMEMDGYTPKRMYLMGLLFELGPMMMCQIKDRLGVTATNVTALVDALEKDGMVLRKPHPMDRRATIVELTSKAEEFLTVNCLPFKERVSELFSIFSKEEQKTFLSYLLRMREVLIEKKILEEKTRSFS